MKKGGYGVRVLTYTVSGTLLSTLGRPDRNLFKKKKQEPNKGPAFFVQFQSIDPTLSTHFRGV
jgi:hypothetical protein